MIFGFAETRCILEVLRLLNSGERKYSTLFRKTKVSHTTLQRCLKELAEKRFIEKEDKGHMDVDYNITEKGKKLLSSLEELKEIIE